MRMPWRRFSEKGNVIGNENSKRFKGNTSLLRFTEREFFRSDLSQVDTKKSASRKVRQGHRTCKLEINKQ